MADAKIIFITGANTGIGLELVKALLNSSQSYYIFLGGRDFQKASNAAAETAKTSQGNGTVEPIQIDIESDASITQAFTTISSKVDHIDCLVNNAGAMFDKLVDTGELTLRQMYNKTWDVNVSGTNIVTETFLPLLLKSSTPRLVFNTSGLSSLISASDTSNPRYRVPPAGLPKQRDATAYRASKVGLNMVMIEWSRMLQEDGVKVFCVSPGFLATGLGGNQEMLKKMGAGDPSVGGRVLCNVVEGRHDENSGRVVREYAEPGVQAW